MRKAAAILAMLAVSTLADAHDVECRKPFDFTEAQRNGAEAREREARAEQLRIQNERERLALKREQEQRAGGHLDRAPFSADGGQAADGALKCFVASSTTVSCPKEGGGRELYRLVRE